MPEEEFGHKSLPLSSEIQEQDQLLRTKQRHPPHHAYEDVPGSGFRKDCSIEEPEEQLWIKVKEHFRDRQQWYFSILSIAVLSLVVVCLDFEFKFIEFQNHIEKHCLNTLKIQQKNDNTAPNNTSADKIPFESTLEIERVTTSLKPKQSSASKTQNLIPSSHESDATASKDVILLSKQGLIQQKDAVKHIVAPGSVQKLQGKTDKNKDNIVPGTSSIGKYVSHHGTDEKKVVQTPPKSTSAKVTAGISIAQKTQASRWIDLKNRNNPNDSLANQEREYYQRKYTISKYTEIPFCIVIPSYNNVKDNRHFKNIKSILQQEYTNYHIVFIDDASTDQTGKKVEQYLKKQTQVPPERYKFIRNEKQMRAMYNLRRAAVQFCEPDDIFLVIDGDDELIGRQILKLYSSLFQMTNAWFIYTNFLGIKDLVGYSRPYPYKIVNQNKYRTYPFVASHLRAFYTQLFRNIKDEDLRDSKGEYLKAANDVAICIPVMEQAGHRVIYMPQLTYFYNSNTGQNNHFLRLNEQKSNDRMLRGKKPYTVLKELHEVSADSNINLTNITSPNLQPPLNK